MPANVWCAAPELKLLTSKGGKSSTTTVLMGAYLTVLEEDASPDGWYKVKAFGQEGFVKKEDTAADNNFLKLFFIDVGQGDSCLVETPTKRMLIDGGQYARSTHNYLTKWKYKWLIAKGYRVRIDAIVVSHFDADHYGGLVSIISNSSFEFGTIYHNGIARFSGKKAERPPQYDTDLGQTDKSGSSPRTALKTSFNNIDDARRLLNDGGLNATFKKFLEAVVGAKDEGRLGNIKRLSAGSPSIDEFDQSNGLKIKVLGPIVSEEPGDCQYAWFDDESHTVNGHSIVLRLEYGQKSILLGGDLNIPSEEHLLKNGDTAQFRVDVAKACHHGSSEFTIDFMEAVKPYATVFSSGDNENYAHPRADALGCAGRYTRGERSMIFSTELARSYKSSQDIHFGLINCRTDGGKIVMAKMFEKPKKGDMWDSYTL
ncbi:MAG: MBL fold metallo-hydrolase [Syntrophorhabdus sp.]